MALGLKTHQTAAKYLSELMQRGFLNEIVKGSFDNKLRHASVYELTMVSNADSEKQPTKEFMSLKLTDDEKQRVEKMTPAWRKKRPTGLKNLPVGFADAVKDQTRERNSGPSAVCEDPTTYNIPWETGNSTGQALH